MVPHKTNKSNNIMRKLIYCVAAIATVVFASCQKEVLAPVDNTAATVSFSVNTPEISTRAYSDGLTASALQYAVYNANGEYLPALTETEATINGSTTVKLQLTTGNTYSVIFWAAAPNAPYTVDFANKTMTVDYSAAASNDEARDAFYAYKTFTVNGAQSETIELRRPFAQLNIGTGDYAASADAGYIPTESAVTVKNIYSTLNLATGEVADEVEVAFASAGINKNETFPVAGYEYLAMNYLLVGSYSETVELEFTYTDGAIAKTRTVGSVPVQRNYRTNLYGNILTSEVDLNIEIKPEYNEPDYTIYNVVVDGVSYDDFATAAAKAMELGKAIEFIQNVSIDADNTITVPAGKELTLNLNGYTLNGDTDGSGNREMFLVKGELNVNGANTLTRAAAEGNSVISLKHVGTNMGWNAMTTIFDVTAGGVLNIANVNAVNFGGSDMAFVAHMNNWGEVTLNVENSTLEANYVAVRVFNSGYDKNNVSIYNSTLKGGSYAFWVHNYTEADFANDSKTTADKQKSLLNFDVFNGTNTFIGKNETPIRLGMSGASYADQYGVVAISDENGDVVEGIGTDIEGNYAVTATSGLEWIADQVNGGNKFTGKTIKLANDIDFGTTKFYAIGYNPATNTVSDFEGTFDGNNKTIKNLKNTDLTYANKRAIGLFSRVNNAVVKNLTLEDFVAATYGGEAAAVACVATGDCLFENITLKNGSVVSYNNDTAGIVGWANVGNFTFKNITVGSDVVIYSLWDSYDTTLGGVVGTLESPSTATMENIEISCVLNAFNDACANYQWFNYRRTGMVIGNMNETKTVDGRTVPDPEAAGVTCENVVVTYGDWMNYHYCEFEANGAPSYAKEGQWKYSRVEGQEWGRESNIDTDNCQHDTDESHNILLPVDQLFGGGQGVSGLREYQGVTVHYPASYRREVSSAAALTEALGKGVSVILDADIDFGTTQLAISGENQVVDLGGHKLTTNMAYGGIALKNGACIVNGTIEHTSTVAAIKAFNVGSIENVTIKATCATPGKTVTAIAVQQGGYVGSIKNVTIEGLSQGIEVGYQSTVDLIENVTIEEHTNGTANGIGLVINGGKVGLAKNSTFKGDAYGVTMHLKGVFAVGLELQNCVVEGETASIYGWDEKGISNTSGSLNLTYDSATTLTGPFVWDFEEECQSVVTLNRPQ